jgi:hypothetical protein
VKRHRLTIAEASAPMEPRGTAVHRFRESRAARVC